MQGLRETNENYQYQGAFSSLGLKGQREKLVSQNLQLGKRCSCSFRRGLLDRSCGLHEESSLGKQEGDQEINTPSPVSLHSSDSSWWFHWLTLSGSQREGRPFEQSIEVSLLGTEHDGEGEERIWRGHGEHSSSCDSNRVMHCLTTGMLRNAFLGDFVIMCTPQYTYTNLDGVVYYTPRLCATACCSQVINLYNMLLN